MAVWGMAVERDTCRYRSQPKTMPRGIVRYPTMVAVVPPRPEIIQSCRVSQELDNFRRREWDTAIEAAAIAKPARIYDLRSTFASNALAAGVTVFELGKIMGCRCG